MYARAMIRVSRVSRLWPLLAALALPALAHAESVAVLGIEAEGAPEEDAARLTEALRQRLSGSGSYTVVPGKDYIELKMVYGCADEGAAQCMAQAGKSLGADKLIYGTLRGKKGGGKLAVTLRVLDVKTANVDRYIPTEQVGADELLAGAVNGVASRLLAALLGLEAKASLTITCTPEDAKITIDDKPAGTSPTTLTDLAPGYHTVGVSKEGFRTRNESVSVRAGQAVKLEVALAPAASGTADNGGNDNPPGQTPPAHEEEAPPGRNLRIAGAVGLVLAGVAGGIAIYTWRSYTGLQDDAHTSLVQLATSNATYASQQSAWFASPTCTPPGNPPKNQALADYQQHCSDGQSGASLTTGLWVGAGVLAIAGVTALVLGVRKGDATAEKSSTASFKPRLRAIGPTAGPTGGGVTASFEF